MNLKQSLAEYIRACFTGLWIESHEHDEALAEISQLCRDENWRLATWDIATGLRVGGVQPTNDSTTDPLAAIRALPSLASEQQDGAALLVLTNFHRFLSSIEIVQALAHQITTEKRTKGRMKTKVFPTSV